MNNFTHNSVLLTESINALNIKPEGIYIDGTFGRGGHSLTIAKILTTGKVIAIDKDLSAINYAKNKIKNNKIEIIHNDFRNLLNITKQKNILGTVDGILLDLGVSSPQFDDKTRGFSFNGEAILDMRMNQTTGILAKDWLRDATEKMIADVLYHYGEERKSRIIAKKIKQFQDSAELTTTKQLANIVSSVVAKTGKKHPATRTFQAIRIYINQELEALQQLLHNSIEILTTGGRLSIITFHSLEDKIVKNFIRQYSRAKKIPKNLPILNNEKMVFKELKKQKPSTQEIASNIRARSAVLRIAEKC